MSRVTVPRDHPVRCRLIDKATERVVDESWTTAELVGAHYTSRCITWNALAVSGGSRWVHPTTGEHYPSGLAARFTINDPDTGEELGIDW